ncbi:MAG: transcriptional repressor [Planctomycetaceae bacterium]|nr:transcriptional repressor [Planctomycetaceae bacterium]
MTTEQFQRNTRQRAVILEELQKLTSHPTAATMYEIVRCRLPKISLGTVYRNLERLVEAGLVRKLDQAGGEARFDGNVQPHDHFRCVDCGRVDDVFAPLLDPVEPPTHDWRGYQFLGRRLEYFGLCPACSARRSERTSISKET